MPSMESSKFIDAFRSVKKRLKLPEKQGVLKQCIATNSDQLENLLQDINNNEFEKNSHQKLPKRRKSRLQSSPIKILKDNANGSQTKRSPRQSQPYYS